MRIFHVTATIPSHGIHAFGLGNGQNGFFGLGLGFPAPWLIAIATIHDLS